MALIIPLIILIVTVIIRLLPKKHHDIVVDMSYEEMISNVRTFAQSMRSPQRFGAGVSIAGAAKRLEKAYREISERVKAGGEIYEFEKQLYENFHLLRRLLEKSLYKGYTTLPHKNLNPRIVTVAHFIIKGCNRRITKDKVTAIIKAFNKYTPLHFNEISMLKNALLYMLVRDMSDIAMKSTHYRKMKLQAERSSVINPEFHLSDSYLYYYMEKWGDPKDDPLVKKSDINTENIENAFITALIDNCVAVGAVVESVRNIDKIIDDDTLADLTPSHHMMKDIECYRLMDIDSIKAYLNAVNKISDSLNVSEKAVVDAAKELEKANGIHFGEFLFGNTRRLRAFIRRGKDRKKYNLLNNSSFVYIFVVLLIVISSGIAFAIMSRIPLYYSIPLAVLISLSLIKPAEHLYSYCVRYEHRFMPRMGYKVIPPEGETMVVVSELLTDAASVKKAFSHLNIISENSPDGNVSYLLLADLKESKAETEEADKEIIDEIDKNYNLADKTRINVLLRKRSLNGSKYSGKERKRGALMELSKYLLEGFSDQYIYQGKELRKPEFLILLDADNEMLPGTVNRAVNSMLHPLNAKYDLLTFGCATNMYSIKTYYSKRFICNCGIPDYGKSSDYIFDISTMSIFCGKGIVRLRSFYDKLKDVFPDNRILSHDIIEGAILQTGAMQDRIYEDAPSNIVSDIERKSRWMRGDYQLLPYIFPKGNVNIKPIYRYTILSNIINALLPSIQLILFISLLLSASKQLLVFLLISLFLSSVLDILGALGGLTGTVRARYVIKSCVEINKDTIFRIMMLPFNAINGAYLFIKTMIRLAITKKNLLEWKTYSVSQDASRFDKYLRIIMPSFVIMTLISMFLIDHIIFLIYTALFIIYALSLFSTGNKLINHREITEDQRAVLQMYAEDIYKYFDDLVKEDNHYLVPDNYQVYPYKGDRYSTSPSNIGLSILAFISAAELKIIGHKEAGERIRQIIDTVIKLPKWNGHLYNWYNTKTLEILYPSFVSSVDSANFLACLLVLREYLKAQNDKELKAKVDAIINDTDLKALYDEELHLFHIGYNESAGEYAGHYDLIASEARILSYIATSVHYDIVHWMRLSRECVALSDNTYVSWSGTAFEYLMSEIFLETPRFSMLGHTINNVVKEQINSKVRGIWGISESGFYRFDETLNYEYKAFGLRELSLRSDYSRPVITPYSSFLALDINPNAAVINLNNIKNRSMYGQYGFYEALDMYSGEKPVNSFMAHHLGMSIAALANFLKDGVIRKYFNLNNAIAASRLILTESIVKNKFKSVKDDSFLYAQNALVDSVKISPNKAYPQHNILTNGAYSVITDDYGAGWSNYGDVYLNKYRKRYDSGFFAYVLDKNCKKIFSPSYSPLREELHDYNITYTSNSSYYHNKTDNISMEIFVPPCFSGEVRKFNYYNKTDEGKDLRIALYTDLNINTMDRDLAHPVFNEMFITTTYDRERNAVIAKRKNLDGSGNLYAAAVIKGLPDIRVDTDRMSFVGRGRDVRNPKVLTAEYSYTGESIGDTLYPCFGIYADVPVAPKSNLEFYSALIISDDYNKLIEQINEANNTEFVRHAEMASKVTSVNFYSKCMKVLNNDLRTLSDYILNVKNTNEQLQKLILDETRAKLYGMGIDPFMKYILLDYRNEASDNLLTSYLGMLKYISKADIKVRLVALYLDNDIYHKSVRRHIEDLIYKERSGGISPLLINKADIDNERIQLLNDLAYAIAGKIKYDNAITSYNSKHPSLHAKPYEEGEICYPSGEGGFTEDGKYIVRPFDKSVTLLPYSNIIAGVKGGTVTTSSGGGFTFASNSREEKITVWNNDPVTDRGSENICLLLKQGQIRLNDTSSGMCVTHGRGVTYYSGIIGDIIIRHQQYMIKDGLIKVFDTMLTNSGSNTDIELALIVEPALGWREDSGYILTEQISDDLLKVTNVRTMQSMGLRVFEGGKIITDVGHIKTREMQESKISINTERTAYYQDAAAGHYKIRLSKQARLVFMLSSDIYMLSRYNLDRLDIDKEAQLEYFNNLSNIRIDSSDKSLDILFNDWLMYQIISSRINGKCGYYQAGGAIGFRDQLQDNLALLNNYPHFVRSHILKAAAHQYWEGDVMHWWHFDRFGVRTKIKDDAVFLVFATMEYIEATGDKSILDEEIPYLVSAELRPNEYSRLETPDISSEKEPLLMHLTRALNNVLKFGEHDLILIGGGDWNDALDAVGLSNKGESVWLTQFCYMTLKKFVNYVDNDTRIKYIAYIERMREAVNTFGYDGKWFRRIYTDRGEWLGSRTSDVCKIDLLSQAFAVLSEIGDKDKTEQAIESAKSLIDYENGYIKLLDPAFDDSKWFGYICAYPRGVRENGGQYTHAAIWYIMALFKMGRIDEGYALLKMINPIEKCRNRNNCIKYKGEPYVIPADIYSSSNHKGRMGWNFYTGSAGWCYRLILEEIAGIRLTEGSLIINPKLPKDLKYMNIEYRYKSSLYKVMILRKDREAMFIDGVEVVNGNIISLEDNGKTSEIIIWII